MADSKLSFFCLGMGIGTALGILFAPKPGEKMREELRSRAAEGGEYLRKRGGRLREHAGDVIERGRDAVGSQREQLAAALEAGRRAYQEATAESDTRMS